MTHPKQLRVLEIIHSFGMGGAETWLMELLRLWSKNGDVQLDFILTGGNRERFDDEAAKLGARLYYCRYERGRILQFVRRFRQILREVDYDAIHDHQDLASGWHFMLGVNRLPKVRVTHVHNAVCQLQDNYGVSWSRRLTAHIGKALVRRFATHIVGTSRQVLTEYGFEERAFRKVPKAALHCGFRTERFAGKRAESRRDLRQEFGWPEHCKIILTAGRVDRSSFYGHPQNQKNSAFALDVGMIYCVRNAGARMIFVGKESPATPILQSRLSEKGLAGRIVFAGVREDIERFMLGADLLLFPSRGEGLGMVAVEAQAADLPVIASTQVPRECVVIPELVRFLDLARGSSVWADHVAEMLNAFHETKDANGQVRASAFAIENSAEALRRLYREGTLP